MAAPKAVLWDADGVLQRGIASWDERFSDAVDGKVEAFEAVVWGELELALTGQLDMVAHVHQAIEDLGITDRDAVFGLWRLLDPVPESRDLVTSLRSSGVPCYLATNQDNLRASTMRELMGYDDLLDGSYYSCEVGAAKPDAAYFLHIADDLGVVPRELVFVDDAPVNVDAAAELGVAAVLWQYDEGIDVLRERLGAVGVPL